MNCRCYSLSSGKLRYKDIYVLHLIVTAIYILLEVSNGYEIWEKTRLLDGAEKEDKGWFPRESREPRTRRPLAGTSIGSVVSRRVMQIRVSAGVNLMVRPQVRATRTARTTHLRANGSSKVEEQEKRHISSFDRYFASDGCSIFST